MRKIFPSTMEFATYLTDLLCCCCRFCWISGTCYHHVTFVLYSPKWRYGCQSPFISSPFFSRPIFHGQKFTIMRIHWPATPAAASHRKLAELKCRELTNWCYVCISDVDIEKGAFNPKLRASVTCAVHMKELSTPSVNYYLEKYAPDNTTH